jgi:hypothetical protein
MGFCAIDRPPFNQLLRCGGSRWCDPPTSRDVDAMRENVFFQRINRFTISKANQTAVCLLRRNNMKKLSLCVTAACFFVALASTAHARSAYDGSWDLAFVTQRGACDPTYNFTVNISNGVVTEA